MLNNLITWVNILLFVSLLVVSLLTTNKSVSTLSVLLPILSPSSWTQILRDTFKFIFCFYLHHIIFSWTVYQIIVILNTIIINLDSSFPGWHHVGFFFLGVFMLSWWVSSHCNLIYSLYILRCIHISNSILYRGKERLSRLPQRLAVPAGLLCCGRPHFETPLWDPTFAAIFYWEPQMCKKRVYKRDLLSLKLVSCISTFLSSRSNHIFRIIKLSLVGFGWVPSWRFKL